MHGRVDRDKGLGDWERKLGLIMTWLKTILST